MNKFENIMHEQTNGNINENQINEIKKKLIQNLSNMNYYGDETYFTQGAFVHVVGLMYLKNQVESQKDLFKKKYYLIHSMMENLGYFIHAYYEHQNDIIYAIKYYNRFINAYNWLTKIDNKSNNDLDKLDNLTANIKSHIRNREDPYILENKDKFNINNNNVNEIKQIILTQLNNLIKKLTKIEINDKPIKTNDEPNKYLDYLESLLVMLEQVINQNTQYTNIRITKIDNKYIIKIENL